MKIALNDIRPNPYRNLERYPLDQPTVGQLVVSIKATAAGFWDNVVVRKNGDVYELAYGHHRLEAAKQAGLKDADFIVKKLSDADMLRVMLLENEGDTRRFAPNVLTESVESLVRAIAQGTIMVEVPEKTKNDLIRNAPSFKSSRVLSEGSESSTESVEHPYTVQSVAFFLGKVKKSNGAADEAIRAVVDALELCELKILKRAAIDATETWVELQIKVREGWGQYEQREREKLQRQREEEQKEERARLRKEAEERLRAAQEKAAEQEKISQAKIDAAAEEERLAKAAAREAETKEQESRAKKEQAEARQRQIEEELRARERERKFKEARRELEAKVEIRKQREAALREQVETRRSTKPAAIIEASKPRTVSPADIVKDIDAAIARLQTAYDRLDAVKEDDRLSLKRVNSQAGVARGLAEKIQRKTAKA